MPQAFSIKTWRINANMTQQDVADKLGVSKPTVIKWEREDACLKNLEVYALAYLFGVSVDNIRVKIL
ncbi:helix-turn-helix transcriptional regulator [Mammaliicoccus lentus]|uniref:helix-turn-helix transcriptional regulator n=1 Tax=Mammaliicoccus lentus TaxID=42858 RepID=UPI002B260282|nr:helix-turn-helix transcriptional regulator [Mammaliicoccus lentus]WQK49201.1 helix-turn-helix transcriptional regulator [Mammaliicoccus lentus]